MKVPDGDLHKLEVLCLEEVLDAGVDAVIEQLNRFYQQE